MIGSKFVSRRASEIVLVSIALAFAVTALTLLVNVAALSRGPSYAEATLARAFHDDTFGDVSSPAPWSIFFVARHDRPVFENTYFHDCPIWSSLLAQPPGGLLTKVVRNARLIPVDVSGAPSWMYTYCAAVAAAVGAESGSVRPQLYFYDRYIIGQRAIAQVLLDNFSVRTSGMIIRSTVFAAFLIVLLSAWWRHNTPIAAIAALYVLFQPIGFLGSTLTFAPLDVCHAVLLFTAVLIPFGRAPVRHLIVIGALYGAFLAMFEILSGGIPMALALLAFVTGASAPDRNSFVERLTVIYLAFATAFVTCILIKIMGSALYEPGSATDFVQVLLHRVHGSVMAEASPQVIAYLAKFGIDAEKFPIAYLVASWALWSRLIGWGSSVFGCLLVVAGVAALGLSTRSLYRRGSANDPLLIACWVGTAALLFWAIVFWNHTVLHGFFMARLLVIPVMSGALAALSLRRAI